MADIINFRPKATLDAAKNLRDFICKCRHELTKFGKELEWDDWRWKGIGQFTKVGIKGMSAKVEDILDPAYIDFTKAYLRYQQSHSPTKHPHEFRALKPLESALLQLTEHADISKISITVLDEAAQIARDFYAKSSAHEAGRELARLAHFVVRKKLVPVDVSGWKNPIPYPDKYMLQTGEKAKKRREKRLPSPEALNAMAEIFANNPTDPKDVFTSATFAMTMCAPSRGTEILELPVDCEVEQKDSKGNIRYGWRFYSGKGFGGDIKWIPTEMVQVAKEAIDRIRLLTESARNLAKWIEKNPKKYYRHVDCPAVPDDVLLTKEQAVWALRGKHDYNNYYNMLTAYGLRGKSNSHTLNGLWQHVVSQQPEDFPWLNKAKKLKYSTALFCMTRNLLHDRNKTSPVILWAPSVNIFIKDLGPQKQQKSIFDRWGYNKQGATPLKVTSHQARHLLNTIAQRGGMSQEQIAKWSGRVNSKQNRVYNHMSEFEMVAKAEELDKSMPLFGPTFGDYEKHTPVTIQEFNLHEKGPVIHTEIGFCVHDFVMSPCDKFLDHVGCNEHVYLKGNREKEERIRFELSEVEKHFKAAQKAIKEGTAGADRWYEFHKNRLERLRILVAIFDNPDIEDGSVLRLESNTSNSFLGRAISAKIPDAFKEEKKLHNHIWNLLGGNLG